MLSRYQMSPKRGLKQFGQDGNKNSWTTALSLLQLTLVTWVGRKSVEHSTTLCTSSGSIVKGSKPENAQTEENDDCTRPRRKPAHLQGQLRQYSWCPALMPRKDVIWPRWIFQVPLCAPTWMNCFTWDLMDPCRNCMFVWIIKICHLREHKACNLHQTAQGSIWHSTSCAAVLRKSVGVPHQQSGLHPGQIC